MSGCVLGLETSTGLASVALVGADGRLTAESTFPARRTMAEQLAPRLARLLAESDTSPAELAGIAVGLGPGSFTSLRVGLAVVKGMALARPLPVVGIGSLETLAAAAPLNDRQPLCAVIAAPKRHVYAALYARRGEDLANCLFGPELLAIGELAERLGALGTRVAVAGLLTDDDRQTLASRGVELLPPVYGQPRAAVTAALGRLRIARGAAVDAAELTPLYVLASEPERRFGVTLARPGG